MSDSTLRGTAPSTDARPPPFNSSDPDPPLWQVLAAFAAIYLIWGSTYLAIKFAIETLPPFLMAAVRFIVAGGLLYAIRRPGRPKPTGAEWGRRRSWG